MGGDNFLDDTVESSGVTASDDDEFDDDGMGSAAVAAGAAAESTGTTGVVVVESDLSLGGLEEPLNILLSNPPWLEPRRLFPASLKVGYGNGGLCRKVTRAIPSCVCVCVCV